MTIENFGTLPTGETVERITLNSGRLRAKILTLGAIVQDLRLDGIDAPLVLGSPTAQPYLDRMRFFGAIVGRYANRISEARFDIDGTTYKTSRNWRDRHTLHGGAEGVWQKIWTIVALSESSVTLGLTLPDGDMGFPGEMSVTTKIILSEDDALSFDIRAMSTAATPCSFTHHGYFNLDGSDDATAHMLQVEADRYLAVNEDLLPTGAPRSVDNTPLDFRDSAVIGKRDLDHNLCLTPPEGSVRRAAELYSPKSGVRMTVHTNQPGLQVYDGRYIPQEGHTGLEGRIYRQYAGIALEAQAWPDAPNRPDFPDAILRKGETYHHQTNYVFEGGNLSQSRP